MDLLTGKGPSKRHELFYFGGANLGARSLDDIKFQFLPAAVGLARPERSPPTCPSLVNIRQDPFERFPPSPRQVAEHGVFGYGNDFFAREFWRFVIVQQ